MPRTSEKRIPLSLNVPRALRDALDRRVEEGRAQGFPVERAALAVAALERGLAGGAPSAGCRVPMTPEVREAFDALEGAFGDLLGRILSDDRACDMLGEIREHVAVVRGVFS
jgi:hypothetical protein